MTKRTRDKEPDERWKIDLDLLTKDGRPIELNYATNVEIPNRGLIYDEITAFVDGDKAGYMRIEILPPESIENYYPSGVLNYINNFVGITVFGGVDDWYKPTDVKTADMDTLNHVSYMLHAHGKVSENTTFQSFGDFRNWSANVLEKTKWFKSCQNQFEEFCSRKNDPMVSFASTDTPNKIPFEKSWEGLGIGRAMYIAMALELERRGLQLRRSAMASDSAMRLWQTFERDGITEPGPVVNDDTQPRLSADLIRMKLNIALPVDKAMKP